MLYFFIFRFQFFIHNMQFHQIQRNAFSRLARRVGRGGKRGTYSGRGIKGQKARAGAKFRPAERDIIKKIPKLRGYRFTAFRPRPAIINLDALERVFTPGEIVSPDTLLAKHLIRRVRGKTPQVKILGRGVVIGKFVFRDVIFSKSVAEKLKSQGL